MKLPPRLDLSNVAQLVLDLQEIDGDVEIDASEVGHLGALGLQALIAASRQSHANGHKFEMTGVSDKVVEQLSFMGTSPEQLMEGSL